MEDKTIKEKWLKKYQEDIQFKNDKSLEEVIKFYYIETKQT